MPKVGIVMGSDSDLKVMSKAADMLDKFGIEYEMTIISAHRMPDVFFDYAKAAEAKDYKVIIAGAGMAAGTDAHPRGTAPHAGADAPAGHSAAGAAGLSAELPSELLSPAEWLSRSGCAAGAPGAAPRTAAACAEARLPAHA